jgi:ubiquinone/menaquinone biosynthesis C-methylase UbiE
MPRAGFDERYGGNAAENYERFFVPAIGAPLAADLVETAALRPGERVLDVACGTGVVARLAAQRVGPTGSVAGLDLNPGMLAVARSVAPSDFSIHWYESSAEAMPLSDETFDAVLCQVSLQFLPDKIAALRQMRRVLVTGGRLILSVPGPTPAIFAVMDEALERHIGPEAARFVRLVFSLHDPDELRALITEAGFHDVTVRADTKELKLAPPEEFLWQYIQSTPLAAAVAGADDAARDSLQRDVALGCRRFVEGGGSLVLQQGITVATGHK